MDGGRASAEAVAGNGRDEADSRLEIVLDSMADSHVLVDADWRVTIVNRAAEQFFGLNRDTMRGRCLWDIFPSARGTAFQANFERAAAGQTVRFETSSVLFNGVVIAVSAAPLPDGGISIAFDDITDRKRAEAAVRESEARFRLIADSAPVPMWVTSIDRKRWFVNRAYVEFLGVSYEEAVDFDWRTIIHPDDLPRIIREQVEKEASLQSFDLEARYRGTNGEWCWMRSFSQPRWGPDGEHVGFIGVAVDITISKNAEVELQRQVAERTAEMEALYNRTPIILQSLNAEGRLVSVSDRWLEFMGFASRDEVLGHPVTEFATPESLARFREQDWPALLAGRDVTDSEYQAVKKSGEIADVLISSRVWKDSSGRFKRTMGAIVDVTGRKRTEEALRQAQKVEAMGQLTGGVAHDFNNLLSPIIGGLDLLQRRGVGDDRDRRTISGALQAAERAKTLVQRLLAFARRQPLQPAPVDASKLIEGMSELIASTAGPRVRVLVDAPVGLPPCLADPNQIEMALLNLSVNARDAMPDGGVLTIAASAEAAPADAGDLGAGRYIRLTVADTGLGMDETTLARAIEPFFSTKGVGRGTGLGLSMVHGLAAQLNGALRLRSSPSEGTEVQLWLPCADSAPRPLEQGRSLEDISGHGTVLLVDDEALVRSSTAEMLADMGFEVVEHEDAEQAIRYLAEGGAADLIVTDHLMPGMTGVELALAARQLRPGTPALIISGYAEASGLDPSLPRLTKPFRHADLAAIIGEVLG
jgi:PAS domain S-box-containing protein